MDYCDACDRTAEECVCDAESCTCSKHKSKKKQTVAPAATGTTTANVAPFQHRLFGNPLTRKKPKELYGAKGKDTPPEWCDCENDGCLCKKGRCDCNESLPPIDFPTHLDREDARIGGGWTWKKPKPRCLPGEMWNGETQSCELVSESVMSRLNFSLKEWEGWLQAKRINTPNLNDFRKWIAKFHPESKNQAESIWEYWLSAGPIEEVTTTSGVAGTNTRFYGATWEGNYFEEAPKYDAWENEHEFWDDPKIVPHGYEWVHNKKMAGREIVDVIRNKDLETAQVPRKSYTNLIKKLKKVHNI